MPSPCGASASRLRCCTFAGNTVLLRRGSEKGGWRVSRARARLLLVGVDCQRQSVARETPRRLLRVVWISTTATHVNFIARGRDFSLRPGRLDVPAGLGTVPAKILLTFWGPTAQVGLERRPASEWTLGPQGSPNFYTVLRSAGISLPKVGRCVEMNVNLCGSGLVDACVY